MIIATVTSPVLAMLLNRLIRAFEFCSPGKGAADENERTLPSAPTFIHASNEASVNRQLAQPNHSTLILICQLKDNASDAFDFYSALKIIVGTNSI